MVAAITDPMSRKECGVLCFLRGQVMKKCPVCSEEIRTDAIKCRYCGERFDTKPTPSKAASFPHEPSPWQIYEKLKSTWSLAIIGFLVCIIVPVVIMAGQKDNTETDNRLVSAASAPAPAPEATPTPTPESASVPAPHKKYEFQADLKAEARREVQRPLHKRDGTLRERLHAMSPSQFKSYVDEHPGIPGLSYIEHKDGKIEKVIPPEPVSSGSGADADAAQAQREDDSGSQQLESDTQRQQLESDLQRQQLENRQLENDMRRQKLESNMQRRQLEDDIRRQKLENRQLENDMRRQKLESDRQRRQLESDMLRQQTESDLLRWKCQPKIDHL